MRRRRPAICSLLFLFAVHLPGSAQGYELDVDTLDEAFEMPTREDIFLGSAEEPESILDFFNERTEFGVGYDHEVTDNFNNQIDNKKESDFISVLEGFLFFADPRGAVLYGLRHEINAYRYHVHDKNSMDHDFRGFFDYDPGGRTQLRLDYDYNVNNLLSFSSSEIDIIRQTSDFQRVDSQTLAQRARYALNETNALAQSFTYSTTNDKSGSDGQSDRESFKAVLDWDHDLTPAWQVFGGYEFVNSFLPKNKLKNSQAHGIRLGARHELTEIDKLALTLTIGRTEFDKVNQKDTDINFAGSWEYVVSPRLELGLAYTDKRLTSFIVGRRRSRSQSPSLSLSYSLTPTVVWDFGTSYVRQTSDGSDVLTGVAASETKSTSFTMTTGFLVQVREDTSITLDYLFSRSKTRDITKHTGRLGVEIQL